MRIRIFSVIHVHRIISFHVLFKGTIYFLSFLTINTSLLITKTLLQQCPRHNEVIGIGIVREMFLHILADTRFHERVGLLNLVYQIYKH